MFTDRNGECNALSARVMANISIGSGHREVETTIEFMTRATSGTSRAIDPAVSISKPEVTTPSRNTT